MFPPSVHPSGEVVEFVADDESLEMDADTLYARVCDVAIAAVVLDRWSSLHHSDMGDLAGFLLRYGFTAARLLDLYHAIGRLAPGGFEDEIVKFARATIDRFERGDKVTGGRKLADALGADVVSRMRAWLKVADADAIEEMNERHFWTRVGGKSVIGRTDDPSGVVVFQPVRELYSEYANRTVQVGVDRHGNAQYANLFETWLKSPNRHQYLGGVVMAAPPRTAPDSAYNLWKGFAIKSAAGDCSKFLAHLRDVVCSGDAEHYDYLMKWCAFAVQNPGIAPGVAIVMRGKPAAGKGTVVRMFERIFGKHHCAHLDRSTDLVNFNALISGKVVVFADEAFFAGDKQNLGALKRIITEPTVRISRKHIDSYEEQNNLHIVMATNEKWAVHAQPGERRFFVVDVSEAHQDETPYFDAIYDEMDNGGAAAFLDVLEHIEVTQAEIRKFPRTDALRDQQEQSLDLHLAWWRECLYDGRIGQVEWDQWIPADRLYDAYKTWARERTTRFLDKIEFGKQMSKFITSRTTKPATVVRRVNGDKQRCWELRGLMDARSTFDAELRTVGEWPDTPGASQMKAPF
jgi:hypothetical protein